MAQGICAYCGTSALLTKEHIWPQCIITRAPSYVMRFSAQAKKVFGADLIVKDVCARCNNGPLSALDTYACNLYDGYFSRIVDQNERVVFRYNHDQLLRWLLKVSYNSSRTTHIDTAFHRTFKKYMLGEAEKPDFVSVMLDIVVPSVINGITLEPRATRCARIFVGRRRPWVCVRLVAVNSYYFYLVITGEKSVSVPEDELLEFRQGIKGTLLPTSGELELQDHESDFFEMHAPHLLESRGLYEEFMAIYRRPH
jgi:hypothetical protein